MRNYGGRDVIFWPNFLKICCNPCKGAIAGVADAEKVGVVNHLGSGAICKVVFDDVAQLGQLVERGLPVAEVERVARTLVAGIITECDFVAFHATKLLFFWRTAKHPAFTSKLLMKDKFVNNFEIGGVF